MTMFIKRMLLAALISVALSSTGYAANRIHYVINNHLGAPEMLIDEDQHVVWQAEYDEFGKATILVKEVEFNHRFPGQYYDKETGLTYNYYRDYDPSLGRYYQSDPIGLAGGINTYGYVGGNPVNYVDPWGLARQKDPNGQECMALARKIENIKKDIEKRKKEYDENPLGLPEVGPPGSKPRESRQGHLDLINDLIEILAGLEAKYASECGGGTEPALDQVCPDGGKCEQVAQVVVVGGFSYFVYRCIRMVPSLAFPPSIPANVIIP